MLAPDLRRKNIKLLSLNSKSCALGYFLFNFYATLSLFKINNNIHGLEKYIVLKFIFVRKTELLCSVSRISSIFQTNGKLSVFKN